MLSGMKTSVVLPHPKVIATRKALAQRPKPSLEQVLAQAKASQKFRLNASSNGPVQTAS